MRVPGLYCRLLSIVAPPLTFRAHMQIPPPSVDIRCRLEWGRRGAAVGAERGDILVVVDVLSFSSAVATAVERGASIYPCADGESAAKRAGEVGGEVAVHRKGVPEQGR